MLLMAWSGASFLRESYLVVTRVARHPVLNIRVAGRWLPAARQVGELKRFLAQVDAAVPPGEAIGFEAHTDPSQSLYVYLWAAFLLPSRELVPVTYPDWQHQVIYVASYGATTSTDQLEIIRRFKGGALLRLRQ